MQELIQKQLKLNAKINLLAPVSQSPFTFSAPAKALIQQIKQKSWSKEQEVAFLHYTTDAVLSSFYRINQYYHFNEAAHAALLTVYQELFNSILSTPSLEKTDLTTLATVHYLRLQAWLLAHYPYAAQLYAGAPPLMEQNVVCAEYSAKTQMMVLGMDEQDLKEPILDIGCGKDQRLLQYLQQKGFSVYGIDREATPSATVYRCSWLEFDYSKKNWGTVISHLGFTNHFRHHHLLGSKWHLQYAAIYMQILGSLQKGGKFYYAPDLPFLEQYLNPSKYHVQKKVIGGTPFKVSIVTRNI